MNQGYKCECGKTIGLMADATGRATTYQCPYTKRIQRPQEIIRQEPIGKKRKRVPDAE